MRQLGIELDGTLELADRSIVIPMIAITASENHVPDRPISVLGQHALKHLFGLFFLLQIQISGRQSELHIRIGLRFQRLTEGISSLLIVPLLDGRFAFDEPGRRVLRISLQDLICLRDGLIRFAGQQKYQPQS